MLYFDHAASTFIYPEVLSLLSKSFETDYANPNSQHLLGSRLLTKTEEARFFFLKALDDSKEISTNFYFTSSATESNNTIVKGLSFSAGDTILYCKADHPSLVGPIEEMALEYKLKLQLIPLDKNGCINIESFKKLLNENIKLVALTHVNSQSAVIHDIALLASEVKNVCNAHVHIDAAQSFTKIPFKISKDIDSVSIASHKIGGPKGIAGLYLKKKHKYKVKPLLVGGGQEDGFRASTQAYPLIIAFAEAAKISFNKLDNSFAKSIMLKDSIKSALQKLIPQIKDPFENTSPYIFTFILPGISSDIVLRHLGERGFCLSSTSACSSKKKGLNPVFTALNIAEIYHQNVIRLSLGHDSDLESLKLLENAFGEIWNDIKFLTK